MPKARTRLCLLMAALLAAGASGQRALPRTSDPAQLRQQLWNLINNGDTRKFQTPGILASSPFYRQISGTRPPWHIFPASAQQPPDTFLNRRLGLPVHGRWVSTYVNTLAFDCIKNNKGCSPANGPQQVRLAPGAILVKENYPNVSSPQTVARRTTAGVITVLWKPFEGYCGSRLPFNAPRRAQPEGSNCFGGEWLYAFYILQNPNLNEAAVKHRRQQRSGLLHQLPRPGLPRRLPARAAGAVAASGRPGASAGRARGRGTGGPAVLPRRTHLEPRTAERRAT